MHRWLAYAFITSVLCPRCSEAAPSAQDAIRAVETQLASPVEIINRPLPRRSLRAEMQKNHVPAVSIAVIRHGTIDWTKSYGIKREDGSPVTTDTLFQAASISKSVTTMTALALVEKGKLSLDAPINTQLKSWTLPDNQFTAQQRYATRASFQYRWNFSDRLWKFSARSTTPHTQANSRWHPSCQLASRPCHRQTGYEI